MLEEFFPTDPMTIRMANNIDGFRIDGLSINAHFYFLIAIIAFIWTFASLYKKEKVSFAKIGKRVLIVSFGFFIALEILFSLNYLYYFTIDYKTLYEKPLDAKRIATSPPGLYEFTKFVIDKTPPKAKVAIISPDQEYLSLKLNYYFSPRQFVGTKEAEYIAGYFMPPEKSYKIKDTMQYKNQTIAWIAKK